MITKKIDSTAFHTDLQSKSEEGPKVYQNSEGTFARVLDAHAPRKTKVLRGNQKLHVYNSALKQKASRTKQEDITKYKIQGNLVVKLNRETKLHYFNNLET